MSRVELLDDPEKFDAIKTNLLTITPLKQHEKAVYTNLWNKFGSAFGGERKGRLEWVGDHYQELIDYIKAQYTNGNTIRNYLEAIAHILLAIDKHKFKEIVRPLFNDTLVMQKKLDKERDESLLTPTELTNYVPYPNLMDKFNELSKLRLVYRKDLKLNIYHLLIAVNVLIPPLRRNWASMRVWPARKVDGKLRKVTPEMSATPPPEDNDNYLWEQKPGEFAIVVNSDKIENKRKAKELERQIIELKIEIPDVTSGADLNRWLSLSLEDLPRNNILIGVKTKDSEMGNTSYDKALASMFTPRRPTQNLLRKAYVNYWWSKNLNAGQIRDLAFRMRHTPGVAMSSYLKVNTPREITDFDRAKQYPADSLKEPKPEEVKMELPKEEPIPEAPAPGWKKLPIKIPRKVQIKTPESVAAAQAAAEASQDVLDYKHNGPEPEPAYEPLDQKHEVKRELPRPTPPREPFNYVQYARDYRRVHSEEINRKQAINYEQNKGKILCKQVLGRLNKSQTTKPMAKTIEVYQLYQLKPGGLWLSHMFDGE